MAAPDFPVRGFFFGQLLKEVKPAEENIGIFKRLTSID
jgi:hypothetical protein